MHIYTYIHTYLHTYIHMYINVHTHIYIHIHIHTYTYTYTYIHTYLSKDAQLPVGVYLAEIAPTVFDLFFFASHHEHMQGDCWHFQCWGSVCVWVSVRVYFLCMCVCVCAFVFPLIVNTCRDIDGVFNIWGACWYECVCACMFVRVCVCMCVCVCAFFCFTYCQHMQRHCWHFQFLWSMCVWV